MENLFLLLGIALILATVTGYVSKKLKQPLILAYILSGFLLGPGALGLITDIEPVAILSEMGIVFLLFTVGLHMNVKSVKDVGAISLLTGLGQVIILTLAGMFIASQFGFSTTSSLYIGISLAFSSTIIIVKMLGERNDINSLHGKISIGFLLVQDFIAILALVLISGADTGNGTLTNIAATLLKAVVLIGVLVLITEYLVDKVFSSVAKNQELLFMSSISYLFLMAIASHLLGLSVEIGAFLAGVSLASLPYNTHIENKIRPLRDFFVVIFFITLGTEMAFSLSSEILLPLALLSTLVLLGTPLIVTALMGLSGYRKRTSFLVGLTVAQISEFSLILVNLGHKVGHIGQDVVSLVTAVGVITITISAYMIMYGNKLYYFFSKYLDVFEREEPIEMEHVEKSSLKNHVVVVGYHRVGYGIVNKLLAMGEQVLVIDYDPDVVKQLRDSGVNCIYGDIADPEILSEMNLEEAELVISTAPDTETNIHLLKTARKKNSSIMVIIVAEHVEEALELYEEGADYVVLPHLLGGNHASLLLEDIRGDLDKLLETKLDHIDELKSRQDLHPYHSQSGGGI